MLEIWKVSATFASPNAYVAKVNAV